MSPVHAFRVRPWTELVQELEHLISVAASRGIRIDQSSRLPQFVRHIRTDGAHFPGGNRIELLSQIRTEADEIVLAAGQLTHPPEVPGWEQLFERLRAGQLFAEAHGDKAREAQVEFVMGAMMRSAGAEVSFEQGDARAVFRGETVTFEAKRPASEKNLGKVVREGRNQLARAGGVGVLFLDFAQLATEHASVRVVPAREQIVELLAPRLDESIRGIGRQVHRWVQSNPAKGKTVLAAIGLATARYVLQTSKGLEYGYVRRAIANEVGPPGISVPAWLREFVELFNRINVPPETLRP